MAEIPAELAGIIFAFAQSARPGAPLAIIGEALGAEEPATERLLCCGWRDLRDAVAANRGAFPVLVAVAAPDADALDQSTQLLADGGLYIALLNGDAETPLAGRLESGFRHVARYVSRPLSGISLLPERFSRQKVAPLYQAESEHPSISVLLCSDDELMPLPSGVFERDAKPISFGNGRSALPSMLTPERRLPAPPVLPTQADDRQRTVALANRLLANERRFFGLMHERDNLAHQLTKRQATGGGGGYFDVPRIPVSWPATTSKDGVVRSADPYDRRPEDDVVLSGRQGSAYFSRFDLLTPGAEDFAGAVEHHNASDPVMRLAGLDQDDRPDVSIIIPIYGQLPYTMNSIDSIIGHQSRYSAEIIVIDDCSPDEVSGTFLPLMRHIVYHRQAVNGGFIQSCNDGANMARGNYIVLLNNDTRVVPGWLDRLIDSFAEFPEAGLVGSKMFYPDGSLQEAGGIIWRDGSAWNYGRDDDPNRPQYCHARQVDYVSGCSIAIPATLWRELDGFDQHYRPAYCEDADLCLRIVDSGRQVWFQPTSRLIHYEGKTSGTDTGSGVKAYQIVNTNKLFMRWRRRLENYRSNAQAPYFERERSVHKRILVVDATTPTPTQDAGSVQTVLALKTCRDIGYKPYFVPEHNWLFQKGQTDELQKLGVECVYAPFDTSFTDYIARYGHLFDVVLVYRSTVLPSIIDAIREFAPGAALIFHVADLHFLREERQARMNDDAAELLAAASTKEIELGLIASVDCTITHSEVEAAIIEAELPGAPVVVWPLSVDYVGTGSGFDQRRDICFLGGYRHAPNVDAVRYFVDEIFPLLKTEEPDVRFIVAGANPTDEVLDLASDDIVVTGMIDDLSDLFDASRVFVCPLRFGAGVKGKIMSAMAHGIPIVTTPMGIEGAGSDVADHLLVAADPQEFAAEVLRAYRDRALWERLSRGSQDLVQRRFSPASGREILEQAIERAHMHRLKLDGFRSA